MKETDLTKTTAMQNEKIHSVSFETVHNYLRMIIERYTVYITGSRQEVDDISQEVFLRIWPEWDKLGDLPKRKLGDYVFVTLRNYLINKAMVTKREKRYRKHLVLNSSEEYLHDDILLNEGLEVHRLAMNQLPKKERLIYVLYQNGLNRCEIAERVERSENTINNQVRTACQNVKRYLNKYFDLNISEDGRGKLWKFSSN